MRRIHGDVFTYADYPPRAEVLKEGTTRATFAPSAGDARRRGGPTWTSVQNVRAGAGYRVTRFEDLVRIAAHLAAGNRGYMLFFRGQNGDFVDRNGRTNLFPTLFRNGRSPLRQVELDARWKRLGACVDAIVAHRKELQLPGKTHRHMEAHIALLQHYGLCETPLLDITPSLRVAASFALPSEETRVGYLYVLALPYPHSSISHFVDQDMVLVRLFGVCPFDAVRPHFQEGYLVGKYPIANAASTEVVKERYDNAASRLCAKLVLDDTRGTFFRGGFPRIPMSTLVPENDRFGDALRRVIRGVDGDRRES